MPPIIAILEEEGGGLGVCDDDDNILEVIVDGVLDIDGRLVTNVDEEMENSMFNVDKEIIVLDEVSCETG